MNVIINTIDRPTSTSFEMFAKPDLAFLKEKKTVMVVLRNETKTRVSTTLYFGGKYSTLINLSSTKFKTHEQREMNYFSGNCQTSHFFVKSKKQDLEAYKEYLTEIITDVIEKYYELTLDTLTINLAVGNVF